MDNVTAETRNSPGSQNDSVGATDMKRIIVETRKTVRVIAKEFGVSKSTVHKDLTERLPEIHPDLANEVKVILDYHKSILHLRGGEATKQKYKREEMKSEPVK